MVNRALLRTVTLGIVLVAANAADEPKSPTNPITAEMRATWWRAVAEQAAAKIRFDASTAAVDGHRAEMAKACGERPLIADTQGEPTCGEPPKAAKESK